MATTLNNTRNQFDQFKQAYKEAPWRTQRKWIALFLIVTVAVGIVAGIYLNVTANGALVGREIQALEADITLAQNTNADLETQLATLLSTERMKDRAVELGFESPDIESIEYLVVAGYAPPQPIVISTNKPEQISPAVDPRFSQSLFDWIGEQIHDSASQ